MIDLYDKYIEQNNFTDLQEQNITDNYNDLWKKYNKCDWEVAIRSSARCEDLADELFARQQDTYLNVME
jgi:phosphoenolpyruvate synthase/pyruvate phosphate dikinase